MQHPIINTGKRLVQTRNIFIITIIVITLTILSVWLFGTGQHSTIFKNTILSTSVLSFAFLLFLTTGLYKGIKLKDNLGKITDKIKKDNFPDFSGSLELPADSPAAGDGIGGVIGGIIIWMVFSIALLIFIWIFGVVAWTILLVFAAMLYWIFFRALRLVFKNANTCRRNFLKSFAYAFAYTILYNSWIYGIAMAVHYLIK